MLLAARMTVLVQGIGSSNPPLSCAHVMKRSRAAQKGDNQIDRTRVLEVRIRSSPV